MVREMTRIDLTLVVISFSKGLKELTFKILLLHVNHKHLYCVNEEIDSNMLNCLPKVMAECVRF